jgi:hypothetical protein
MPAVSSFIVVTSLLYMESMITCEFMNYILSELLKIESYLVGSRPFWSDPDP